MGLPLSWHKIDLGPSVEWIGYVVDFRFYCWGVNDAKLAKAAKALDLFASSTGVELRIDLQRAIGFLVWLTGVYRHWRPWLCFFYQCLAKPVLQQWRAPRESNPAEVPTGQVQRPLC